MTPLAFVEILTAIRHLELDILPLSYNVHCKVKFELLYTCNSVDCIPFTFLQSNCSFQTF